MSHPGGCPCFMCAVATGQPETKIPKVSEGSLTEAQRRELEEVRELCPETCEAARALGMRAIGDGLMCFRSVESQRFHYAIAAYSLTNGRVTMTVAHGADSTLPGVGVIGVGASMLIPCGCGNWRRPTDAQTDATRKQLAGDVANEAAREKRRSLTKRRRN